MIQPLSNLLTGKAASLFCILVCIGTESLVVVAPDLPVVYRGGVLHIQSYPPSGQTPFQLCQGAALFAAVCLQEVLNSSETTKRLTN